MLHEFHASKNSSALSETWSRPSLQNSVVQVSLFWVTAMGQRSHGKFKISLATQHIMGTENLLEYTVTNLLI